MDSFRSVMSEVLAGYTQQLRAKLALDLQQSLIKNNIVMIENQKKEIVKEIAKVNGKIDSSNKQINDKIDDLNTRMNNFSKVISNENLQKLDEVLASNNSIKTRLGEHIKSTESRSTEHENSVRAIKSQLEGIEKRDRDLEKTVAFLSEEVTELRGYIKALQQKEDSFEQKIENQHIFGSRMNTKIENLVSHHLTSEVRQRKLNLVFEGIEEKSNANPNQLIIDLLQKSGDLPNYSEINIVYRLGKITPGSNRPILVTFHSQQTRENILKRASKIKQNSGITTLWINRDLPDLTRHQTANTRRCYNLMRSNKLECSVQGTSITYQKKVYHYKDLNKLPQGSRLEDTRLVTCSNDTGLCFSGDLCYISNFYPSPLTYKKKDFVSAEQAFQWAKATNNGDTAAASDILAKEDPFTIKKIGDGVETTDSWRKQEADTLRAVAYNKFRQNCSLGDRLRTSLEAYLRDCLNVNFVLIYFLGSGLLSFHQYSS